jgi:hypothetical protein
MADAPGKLFYVLLRAKKWDINVIVLTFNVKQPLSDNSSVTAERVKGRCDQNEK